MEDLTTPNSLKEVGLGHINSAELVNRVINLLSVNADAREYAHLYAGAVYDRKGYAQSGPVSEKLDRSPYRIYDKHYALRIEVVIPEWMARDEVLSTLIDIAAYEDDTERARLDRERQAKLDRAAQLREEAAALEEQASKLEATAE